MPKRRPKRKVLVSLDDLLDTTIALTRLLADVFGEGTEARKQHRPLSIKISRAALVLVRHCLSLQHAEPTE